MFQTDARPATRNLYLVTGQPGTQRNDEGVLKMNTNAYEFPARLPSNSTVSAGVTLLVSTWFLVAAGAILSDPASPYTQRERATEVIVSEVKPIAAYDGITPAALAIAPEARQTIVVEARRIVRS
jgi:hypothetical protein